MRTPRLPCGLISQTLRPFVKICDALALINRQSRMGTRTGFPGSMLLPLTLPSAGKLRVASVKSVPDILHTSCPARSVTVILIARASRLTPGRAPYSTVYRGKRSCVSRLRTLMGLFSRSSARVMSCSSIRAVFERRIAMSMSFSNAYCRRCRKKAGRKSCSLQLPWGATCWTRSMVLSWTGCHSCSVRSNRASGFANADQGLGRFRHLTRAINRGVINLSERGFSISDQ